MKALSITTALLAAIFFAGVAITFAGADPGDGPGNPDCPNFADADGDGINDNCTGDGTRSQDGTGEKRGAGKGGRGGNGEGGKNEDGPNFVDEDGDGINDNCPNGNNRPQNGTGAKKRINRKQSEDSGAAQAPRNQSKTRDGSCDGSERKTRRGSKR